MTLKTIPALPKQVGYRTGIIGKLHVAPESSFSYDHRKPGNTTRQVCTDAAEAEEFKRASGRSAFFPMVNYSDPLAFRNEKAPGGGDLPPQIDTLPEKPVPPGAQAGQGLYSPGRCIGRGGS